MRSFARVRRLLPEAVALCAFVLLLLPVSAEAQPGPLRQVQAQRDRQGQSIAPRPQARNKGRRPPRGNQLLQRLMQMEPSERRRFLRENQRFRKLPRQQRDRIEDQLRRFDAMPAPERELLRQRFQLFSRLSPTQQGEARRIYRSWRDIPAERRRALSGEVRRLRDASPEERDRRLESRGFAEEYEAEERQILQDLMRLRPQD